MKTTLALLIALILSTAFADSQKPVVKDPQVDIITQRIIKGLKDKPKFMIGDWNSAGSPEMPYNPTYDFLYHCQMQLTDSVERKDPVGKQDYRFYAISDFELKPDQTHLRSEELLWFGYHYYSTAKITDAVEPIPFQTEGHSVGLYFRGGATQDKDLVYLRGYIVQAVGPLQIEETQVTTGDRQSSHLEVTLATKVSHQEDPSFPRIQMRVLCEKKK